jgi:regulation of enolase protein 1 (concanavalin A-like superfamily)
MRFSIHDRTPCVVAALLFASATCGVMAAPELALPWSVSLENTATLQEVVSPTELKLGAPGKTDLFISPDGKYQINKSPRLVLRPEGPFILTAKVRPDLKAMWDAGALVIFNDAEHFAKLCFERDHHGLARVVSVVCNGAADDCTSMPVEIPDGAIYYRIVGAVPGNTFGFYASIDGKTWHAIRGFHLDKSDAVRVGFSAQSPTGEGCTVTFSEISLQRRVPADFWTGE